MIDTVFVLITISICLTIFYFVFVKQITKLRKFFWDVDDKLKDINSQIVKTREDLRKLSTDLEIKTTETQNAIYLSQLDFKAPVFMGGWSIDTFLGKYLVQHIINSKPKTILELGSGSSTLLIAKTLQTTNAKNCTHITVDHEAKYLEITREYARLNGLEDQIIWLECPLVNYQEYEKLWYGGLVEKLNGHKIDLLLIDGPPGPLQKYSRYPALPCLHPYMSENCIVLLDDAGREDEQYIAKKWIESYPEFSLSFELDGHGIAILKR